MLTGQAENSIYLAGTGNIFATGTVNAAGFNQDSDLSLKNNITPLANALSKVQKLRGVSYNWADDKKPQETNIGLIAQELEEVYPEFVHTRENGLKAVNYSQMVAVLIEAIKELSQKVELLEQENHGLKASLQSQEHLINEMAVLKSLVMDVINNEHPFHEAKEADIFSSRK
ncbi:MAG: tail fiber domain-containing protein [Bacteroidales bacterium]|nr:tail fiber domain-containing protein [Bacteroidales bacterium]